MATKKATKGYPQKVEVKEVKVESLMDKLMAKAGSRFGDP